MALDITGWRPIEMSISTNVFRTGKSYRLINHGEEYEFTIEEFVGEDDFVLRDIHTLEYYKFNDLLKFGQGEDYSLEEI